MFFVILLFIEIDTAREIGDAENSPRSIRHSQRCCDDRLSNGTSASRCHSTRIREHGGFERNSSIARGNNY